jgi:hypothetical protein
MNNIWEKLKYKNLKVHYEKNIYGHHKYIEINKNYINFTDIVINTIIQIILKV